MRELSLWTLITLLTAFCVDEVSLKEHNRGNWQILRLLHGHHSSLSEDTEDTWMKLLLVELASYQAEVNYKRNLDPTARCRGAVAGGSRKSRPLTFLYKTLRLMPPQKLEASGTEEQSPFWLSFAWSRNATDGTWLEDRLHWAPPGSGYWELRVVRSYQPAELVGGRRRFGKWL